MNAGSPTFRLEEFFWQPPDRLELTGRWRGVEPAQLREPVLMVVVDGQALTLAALAPQSSPRRGGTGQRWGATFQWAGDPARITGAELRAAPGLTVALPLPSGTRRRFGRLMLEVQHVEGGAHPAAVRWESEPSRIAPAAAQAQATPLREEREAGLSEVIRERTMHADAIRRLRQELDASQTASERLSAELERHRAAHAAAVSDLERMDEELRAMTESRDELRARLRLETEQLRQAQAGLERARSEEAANVERLSRTVHGVRATLERLRLDHRATLRRLAEEIDSALDRVETVAAEQHHHAELTRRALDGDGPAVTASIVRERLGVIAEQTRELREISRALRRRVARARGSADPGAGGEEG